LKTLADYAIRRHYPEALEADDPYAAFFGAVTARQAGLVAHWMAVGFIHGVMNTDNTSIAGETLDYGPCAFMDEFRFDKVFSSIDQFGRYAYSNQPSIALWNLARLAESLLQASDNRSAFEEVLDAFPSRYETTWYGRMRAKLGIDAEEPGDDSLIGEWLEYLEANEIDYTLSFRKIAARLRTGETCRFGDIEEKWRRRVLRPNRTPAEISTSMNAVNPLFIPRNHRIEQAIQQAIDGDSALFRQLGDVWSRPFDEQPELAHLAEPPRPEERVTSTFCGT
jgi:uncharacterized protein YdiU (UPF0061 family)